MLENQFYPTPRQTINRMLLPYMGRGIYNGSRYVSLTCEPPYLEPHGGSGAILDYLTNEMGVPNGWLHTCELDSDLRFLLQGKGYKVVGTNFLEYDEPLRYGLIIMNPPFLDGVAHVWKGWSLLADGGHLVALLNVESLKNPCFKERQNLISLMCAQIGQRFDHVTSDLIGTLKDLEAAGVITFLADCFRDSERSVDVEVVMIRLHKPPKPPVIDFEGKAFELDENTIAAAYASNPLALNDPIADMVARYKAARSILIERWDAQSKLDFYLQGINSPVYERNRSGPPAEPFVQPMSLPEQLEDLKSRFWNTVFLKTNLGRRSPSSFRHKFYQFTHTQKHLAFTENNVREVLEMFFLNAGKIMQDCTVVVFDIATGFHEKNKIYAEGWKTNKSYRVNYRIIMPRGVYYEKTCYSGYVSQSFKVRDEIVDFLEDMDKVLCWLSATSLEVGCKTRSTLEEFCGGKWKHAEKSYHTPIESYFFWLKMFQKGTLHMEFKDRDLLARFNTTAAQGKKWLGGGY